MKEDVALQRFVDRLNAAFAATPPDLAAYFDALETDDPVLRARLDLLEDYARTSLALGAAMRARFGVEDSERARPAPLRLSVVSSDPPGSRETQALLVARAADGAEHQLVARRRGGGWRLEAGAAPAIEPVAAQDSRLGSDRSRRDATLRALTESMQGALVRLRAGELSSRREVEAAVGNELARRLATEM
ncbi:MAG: hypothetical protein AAGC60_14590 [Acidobacteriota bacterium]